MNLNDFRWIAVLLLCVASLQVHAANRLALVIGNDQYAAVDKLRNARNDADLVAATLKEANFDVTLLKDVDRKRFFAELDTLQKRILKGDEVVFFFAGHGVQIGSNSILLPIDIRATSDKEVEREGVPLVEVQDALKDARVSLLVIDACRDNPFPKTGTRSIGATRGLSPPEATRGQAIVLAAGRGQRALDNVPGESIKNGLFTREFVAAIRTPGLDVRSALLQVRERVEERAAKANHEQRPSFVDDMKGNFYVFRGQESVASGVGGVSPIGRPEKIGGTNLEDLEREESARREWGAWQTRMRADFEKTERFEGSADLQSKAWDRFLSTWSQDNPITQDDESLRERARDRREQAAKRYAAGRSESAAPAALAVAAVTGGAARTSDRAAPKVRLTTTMGTIVIELDSEKSPKSVANFLQYVRSGHYSGTVFHRVIENFMVQGGGMNVDLQEKPTRAPIALEAGNGLSNVRGTVSMARTSVPDSATAQFFINVVDNQRLDSAGGGYAVFGKVIEGMNIVDRIKAVPVGNKGGHQNVPQQAVLIQQASIISEK